MAPSFRPASRSRRHAVCLPDPGRTPAGVQRQIESIGWELHAPQTGAPPCGTGILVIAGCADGELHRLREPLQDGIAERWIAILDAGDLRRGVVRDLVARHCQDFLTLPLDDARLRFALGHACGMAALQRSERRSPALPDERHPILGQSSAILQIREQIQKIARSDYPVLLQGESGTGKELVSRCLHDASARRARPFIAVNCASLAPTLIHAELFGYERGAFTGALQRHKGHLESAHGGTILLDEIGDLSPDLQLLLLRFLDGGTLQRVGGRETLSVDARVIAATHVNLEHAVRDGRFREDLYYRLNVLALHLPALRDRLGDAEFLAQRFLQQLAPAGRDPMHLSPCAIEAIRGHGWPGNVRELCNRVRRALVLCEGTTIRAQDLGLSGSPDEERPPNHADLRLNRADLRRRAERELVFRALEGSGGHAGRAASLIGVSRATFYRMIGRHNPPSTCNDAGDVRIRP